MVAKAPDGTKEPTTMTTEPEDPDEAKAPRAERFAAAVGYGLATVGVPVVVLGLLLLVVLTGIDLYPDDLPKKADPNFVDTIFDSRAVIWVSRAAVILAAGYAAIAAIALTVRREWPESIGPSGLKVAQKVKAYDEATALEIDRLRTALNAQIEENLDLEDRLEATQAALQEAYEVLDSFRDPSDT